MVAVKLILEFVSKPGGGDGWYFMQDGEGSRRKVFNGYGKHEVKFHWQYSTDQYAQLKTKVCLVDFKPGTVRILERILGPGAEATLAIRRPEMQQLVDIDEPDVPVGKRARTGQ